MEDISLKYNFTQINKMQKFKITLLFLAGCTSSILAYNSHQNTLIGFSNILTLCSATSYQYHPPQVASFLSAHTVDRASKHPFHATIVLFNRTYFLIYWQIRTSTAYFHIGFFLKLQSAHQRKILSPTLPQLIPL